MVEEDGADIILYDCFLMVEQYTEGNGLCCIHRVELLTGECTKTLGFA